jgi:glutaminyl-peptide cyclotransferase
MRFTVTALFVAFLISGCGDDRKSKNSVPEKPVRVVDVPTFNADTAFFFIQKQVSFGPRIPNTKAHFQTGEYLVQVLKKYGAKVSTQEFESRSFDGQKLNLRNIIASYAPEKKKRILLAAHWDTRPFADKDTEAKDSKFDGANDGASGVGVLTEIARLLGQEKKPDVGVDIIFFDGEDWGEKNGTQDRVPLPQGLEEWWCLGSQYWVRNKHQPNYSAYFGILLDMVGAANAQFHKEGHSLEFAPGITDKVWSRAATLGYSHVFVPTKQDAITDDHYFVNTKGKIPMIDIVHFQPGVGYFGDFHHSRKDNMEWIDRKTLKAVGETVLSVVYHEEE